MVIAASQADNETQITVVRYVDEEEDIDMAMVPERSRTNLHNFSTLPCFTVKWGRQKQLRCVKDGSAPLNSSSDPDCPTSSSSSPDHSHGQRQHRRRSPSGFVTPDRKRRSADDEDGDADGNGGGGGGIEAMREKLMLDLRTEVHQMKAAILTGKRNAGGELVGAVPATVEPRPWNLRTRRAVCKEPNNNTVSIDRRLGSSPAKNLEVKSPMRGFEFDVGEKGPRAKFSACLSKQEIEEDFLSILGNRPARRPKKRPRYVQRHIDTLCPGFWLSEITPDMYKVNENPEAVKR